MHEGLQSWEGREVGVEISRSARAEDSRSTELLQSAGAEDAELQGILEKVEQWGITVFSREGYKAPRVLFLPWHAVINIYLVDDTEDTAIEE